MGFSRGKPVRELWTIPVQSLPSAKPLLLCPNHVRNPRTRKASAMENYFDFIIPFVSTLCVSFLHLVWELFVSCATSWVGKFLMVVALLGSINKNYWSWPNCRVWGVILLALNLTPAIQTSTHKPTPMERFSEKMIARFKAAINNPNNGGYEAYKAERASRIDAEAEEFCTQMGTQEPICLAWYKDEVSSNDVLACVWEASLSLPEPIDISMCVSEEDVRAFEKIEGMVDWGDEKEFIRRRTQATHHWARSLNADGCEFGTEELKSMRCGLHAAAMDYPLAYPAN